MLLTTPNPRRLHLAIINEAETCACGGVPGTHSADNGDCPEEWYCFCPTCEALVEVEDSGPATCENGHAFLAIPEHSTNAQRQAIGSAC